MAAIGRTTSFVKDETGRTVHAIDAIRSIGAVDAIRSIGAVDAIRSHLEVSGNCLRRIDIGGGRRAVVTRCIGIGVAIGSRDCTGVGNGIGCTTCTPPDTWAY